MVEKVEKIKPVRAHMLGKLMKYDFRADFKFLVPCYLVLLGLSAVGAIGILLGRVTDAPPLNVAAGLFVVLFVLAAFGVGIGVCIAIPARFDTDLFSSRGYLTLSIPATAEEHIFSKLISGLLCILLSWLVVFAAVCILLLPSGFFPVLGRILRGFLETFEIMGSDMVWASVEAVFYLPLSAIATMEVIHCCICLGQLFTSKNRRGMSVLMFFIFSSIMSIVETWLPFLTGWYRWGYKINYHAHMWILIALVLAFDIGAFFLQRWVLKKKVNLA